MCRSAILTNTNLWPLFMIGMLCVAGCGDEGRGGLEVSGSVILDGDPMPDGSIVFVPLAAGHKAAGEITAGAFHISAAAGPIPGSYRVEVYAPEASSVPLDDPLAYAKNGPPVPPPNPVAEQFNTQSTLTADVTAESDNRFSFEVRSVKR